MQGIPPSALLNLPGELHENRLCTKERVLIPRYTREEMGRVWSDANRFQKWLDVELAATETLAEAGQVPREAAAIIRERARIDVARIMKSKRA